jgi:pimeloyl-ACP methyl ester carboxylesterase
LALREAVRRTAWRRRPANQARALAHVFAAQVPLWPERRLTEQDALGVQRLFQRWAGPGWARSGEFGEVVATHRRAMLVAGVAHSALEYYRWAVRSQLRADGRRFAAEVDRRLRMPVLRLHGGADPAMLEATAEASATWCGPHSVYCRFPHLGHFPHQEAPAAVTEAIAGFLGR